MKFFKYVLFIVAIFLTVQNGLTAAPLSLADDFARVAKTKMDDAARRAAAAERAAAERLAAERAALAQQRIDDYAKAAQMRKMEEAAKAAETKRLNDAAKAAQIRRAEEAAKAAQTQRIAAEQAKAQEIARQNIAKQQARKQAEEKAVQLKAAELQKQLNNKIQREKIDFERRLVEKRSQEIARQAAAKNAQLSQTKVNITSESLSKLGKAELKINVDRIPRGSIRDDIFNTIRINNEKIAAATAEAKRQQGIAFVVAKKESEKRALQTKKLVESKKIEQDALQAKQLADKNKMELDALNIKQARQKQLALNIKNGKTAEAKAAIDLKNEGYSILGSQVSVRTPAGRRVVDHLVQNPKGTIQAIEVKSGDATRNSMQKMKDKMLETEGGIVIGKNAPDSLKGEMLVIQTVERRY